MDFGIVPFEDVNLSCSFFWFGLRCPGGDFDRPARKIFCALLSGIAAVCVEMAYRWLPATKSDLEVQRWRQESDGFG